MRLTPPCFESGLILLLADVFADVAVLDALLDVLIGETLI